MPPFTQSLIVANIVVFLLGIFLGFIEIAFIVLPLFVPAAQLLGIDLVWFGVVMAVNLQTAFISPPVGFSLFYLQGVAPKEVSTADIHKSAVPFMVLQLVVLALVMIFPQTVQLLIDGARRRGAALARDQPVAAVHQAGGQRPAADSPVDPHPPVRRSSQ